MKLYAFTCTIDGELNYLYDDNQGCDESIDWSPLEFINSKEGERILTFISRKDAQEFKRYTMPKFLRGAKIVAFEENNNEQK